MSVPVAGRDPKTPARNKEKAVEMAKTQVKVYLQDVHLELLDSIVEQGLLGASRGEVIRWLVQDYLLNNSGKYGGVEDMLERIRAKKGKKTK